jgi:hypothetical protein
VWEKQNRTLCGPFRSGYFVPQTIRSCVFRNGFVVFVLFYYLCVCGWGEGVCVCVCVCLRVYVCV